MKIWSIHDVLYKHFDTHRNKGYKVYNSLHIDMMFYFRIDDGRK